MGTCGRGVVFHWWCCTTSDDQCQYIHAIQKLVDFPSPSNIQRSCSRLCAFFSILDCSAVFVVLESNHRGRIRVRYWSGILVHGRATYHRYQLYSSHSQESTLFQTRSSFNMSSETVQYNICEIGFQPCHVRPPGCCLLPIVCFNSRFSELMFPRRPSDAEQSPSLLQDPATALYSVQRAGEWTSTCSSTRLGTSVSGKSGAVAGDLSMLVCTRDGAELVGSECWDDCERSMACSFSCMFVPRAVIGNGAPVDRIMRLKLLTSLLMIPAST